MMYHDDLNAALGPLVAGGYHPVVFPQPKVGAPRWPAIRGTLAGLETFPDICGDSDEDADTPRVQLDIVTEKKLGYAVHAALVAAVRARMKTFTVPARIELELEQTDEPTDTYRSIVDYSLHGSN